MPTACYVCRNSKAFHRFPKDEARLRVWMEHLCLETEPPEHARLCSEHFNSSDIYVSGGRRFLNSEAVPSRSVKFSTSTSEENVADMLYSKILSVRKYFKSMQKNLVDQNTLSESVSNPQNTQSDSLLHKDISDGQSNQFLPSDIFQKKASIQSDITEDCLNISPPRLPDIYCLSSDDDQASCSHSNTVLKSHPQERNPPLPYSVGHFVLPSNNEPDIVPSHSNCEDVSAPQRENIIYSCHTQSSGTVSVSGSIDGQTSTITQNQEDVAEKVLGKKGYSQTVINNILKKKKKVYKYSSENISEAIVLRSISKKAYETCRKNKMTFLPLPTLKTLNRRISHFSCAPGIQNELFNLIRYKLSTEDTFNQESVIMFDEMQLQECTNYNGRLKILFENNKKVQVVLLRGLFNSFQQIIYFDFDQVMNFELLVELITLSEKSYARVRAMVCDMGNQKLLSKLGVYKDKQFHFSNPVDSQRKVYIFCDIPHCFKNLRNNMLDYKMVITHSDTHSFTVDKHLFKELIEKENSREFKICPKLSEIHINVRGHERQRVKYATQLLSKSVSDALIYLYDKKYEDQANTIKVFDNFFDVMNSRTMFADKNLRCGLGIHEEEQKQILSEMADLVSKMRFINKKGKAVKMPFQAGILVSIKSVISLYDEVKSEGASYLLTTHVNQDILENKFSKVRYMGGNNTHPTAANVCDRIRLLCVSRNVKCVIDRPSVEIEDSGPMLSAEVFEALSEDYSDSSEEQSETEQAIEREESVTDCAISDVSDDVLRSTDAEKDIFEYIVGAICRKLSLGSKDEVQEKNKLITVKGGPKLIQPREDIVETCRKIDDTFDLFNGNSLKRCLDPIGSVIKLVMRKYPSFDPRVVKYFCRMKFFSRIKRKNIELKLKKSTSVRIFKQNAQFVN